MIPTQKDFKTAVPVLPRNDGAVAVHVAPQRAEPRRMTPELERFEIAYHAGQRAHHSNVQWVQARLTAMLEGVAGAGVGGAGIALLAAGALPAGVVLASVGGGLAILAGRTYHAARQDHANVQATAEETLRDIGWEGPDPVQRAFQMRESQEPERAVRVAGSGANNGSSAPS